MKQNELNMEVCIAKSENERFCEKGCVRDYSLVLPIQSHINMARPRSTF